MSIVGFASTALKYPWVSMLENVRIWRNIAPPMQLKPAAWKMRLILRLKVELSVIGGRKLIRGLMLNLYELQVLFPVNLVLFSVLFWVLSPKKRIMYT